MAETVRTLQLRLARMENDEKNRHVVAAAVSCEAPIILTFNVRHFRREHLEP